MAIFKLTLQKTYYRQGFFNVTVDFDHYVRKAEGEISIVLGNTGQKLKGRIDRQANMNGTARIHGGADLRDWFERYFTVMDTVDVDLSSQDVIRLSKP